MKIAFKKRSMFNENEITKKFWEQSKVVSELNSELENLNTRILCLEDSFTELTSTLADKINKKTEEDSAVIAVDIEHFANMEKELTEISQRKETLQLQIAEKTKEWEVTYRNFSEEHEKINCDQNTATNQNPELPSKTSIGVANINEAARSSDLSK